jgi:polyhydroxybutyrate depolymerase
VSSPPLARHYRPMLTTVSYVFAVLIATATACGGSVGTALPSHAPSGVSHGTLVVDGQSETYRVFRPPSLDPKVPSPLVLALHGSSFGGDKMASLGSWDAKATSGGFMAAFPDWGWDAFQAPPNEDVTLISRLLDRIESEFTIDKTRIYIVGASTGAEMAYVLACQLSDRVVAIASVLGEMVNDDCRPARPVSILEMHGTADSALSYDAAASAIQRWVTLDSCASNPLQSVSGITKTSVWSDCREGTVVRFDTVDGGQHRWFGSTVEHDSPPLPGEPDATTVVWDFFRNLAPRS